MGTALGLLFFFGMPSASSNTTSGGSAPGSLVGEPAPGPFAGSPAPDFKLESLDGTWISLSELKGRPVLVNFWFTTCGPCLIEMPLLQARHEQYRDDGFRVLAVDFDEPKADVQDYAQKLGLTFDILLDPGAVVQDLYRVRGYPTSFFVDPDGVIQAVHIGSMSETDLDGYLAKIGLQTQ